MAQRSPRRWRRFPASAREGVMSARIINGKAIAAELRVKVAAEVKRLSAQHGITPGLAVVLAGNNPASESYVGSKAKATKEAGTMSFDHRLPDSVSQAELMALVQKLNADPAVHGILVQLPLPQQIDAQQVLDAIDPAKDVDGFHPVNAGRLAARLRPAGEDGASVACRIGGSGDRPLQHCRQAGDATAARGKRHCHHHA